MWATPRFWFDKKESFLTKVLWPFEKLYALFFRMNLGRGTKLSVPVICVGNITVGGAGKTPVVHSIVESLKRHGFKPHILLRGYGAKSISKPTLVDLREHAAHQVGDEALLHARLAPTWVFADRLKSAKEAVKEGADILVMDDGFQNNKIQKDYNILVFDGARGLGNEHLLPAGPLREELQDALKRTDAVVILGEDKHNLKKKLEAFHGKIFEGTIDPHEDIERLCQKKLVAFAGIGNPHKFFSMLQKYNCHLAEAISFPDHHSFTSEELQCLSEKESLGQLTTTLKDYVRLPEAFAKRVMPIKVKINWKENIEEHLPIIKDRLN